MNVGKAGLVKCHICGKEYQKRGIVSHLRLKHKIRVEVEHRIETKVIPNLSQTQVGLKFPDERDNVSNSIPVQVETQVKTTKYIKAIPCDTCGQVCEAEDMYFHYPWADVTPPSATEHLSRVLICEKCNQEYVKAYKKKYRK